MVGGTLLGSPSAFLRIGPRIEDHERERNLALQRVGCADDGAFGDVRMRGEDLLHRAGRKPVPGDVDHVIRSAHHPEVTVLVSIASVRGLIVAGEAVEVLRPERLVVAPERRSASRGKRELDGEVSHLAVFRLASVVSENAHVVTRNRLRGRAWLHGKGLDPETVGGDGPAGFRLPVVIDDRYPQLLLGP